MGKALILAGSHLLCLVAGGNFIHSATKPDASPEPEIAAGKSGPRSTRTPLAGQGEALAAEVLAASKAPIIDAEKVSQAAGQFSAPGSGEKKVRELAGDDLRNPPATAEFAGALLAWFRENPKAAFDFMYQAGAGKIYDAILVQALGEMSLDGHLALARAIGDSPSIFRVGEILGTRISEMNTAEAAAFFKESGILKESGTSDSPAILQTMIRGWPAENAAGFLELALATGELKLVQKFLQGPARRSSELLVLMDGRKDLPEAFAAYLASAPELRGHLYRYADPSVPLDERIAQMKNLAWLKDATPEALREGALKQISTVDINELMKTGPDYRYAFRHGAMTADEILAAVRATFPELAAASDFETRVRVFNELASEDAQAAFSLISHLPEEERNLAVIHQSRWTFRDTSPEAFFEMINLAPGPDSAEAAPQRADAWSNYSSSAYHEYGDFYLDWVRELPAGVNRDVARSTLAKVLRRSNQAGLAAEFEKP